MYKIIALAALSALSATASAANLIKDGSFESPSVTQAANSWSLHSTLPGWSVGSVDGGAFGGLEVRNNVAGTAQNGSNFIELDGNENDFISQTFSTVKGQSYQLTFWYADRAGVAANSLGFEAEVESGKTHIDVNKGAFGDNGAGWHEQVIDFVAGGKHTTFTLSGAGTSDSYGTSFDNFSAMTAAVPEPASLGLFAAGLAMLGAVARRRRQA